MGAIAIDIETDISNYPTIYATSTYDEEGNFEWCYGPPQGEYKRMVESFSTWITHNGTNFDVPVLLRHGLKMPASHYDTLVGEACILTSGRASSSRSLAATLARHRMPPKLENDHQGWHVRPFTSDQIEYMKHDVQCLHRRFSSARRAST